MTWKEFNADPMGRMLNGGIAVSAIAGIYIAFSTNQTMGSYVMMGAVLITLLCGIGSIGLAINYAARQALILIFVLPLIAQLFFIWVRIRDSNPEPGMGAVMVIASVLFTYLALFPPKPEEKKTETASATPESSH
jgi:4-amino-4-deoxy-L-arabinose transferase-like glycosyltransferase